MDSKKYAPQFLELIFRSNLAPPLFFTLLQYSQYGHASFFFNSLSKSQNQEFTNIMAEVASVTQNKPNNTRKAVLYFVSIIERHSFFSFLKNCADNYLENFEQYIFNGKANESSLKELIFLFSIGQYSQAQKILNKNPFDGDLLSLWKAHILFHSGNIFQAGESYNKIRQKNLEIKFQLILSTIYQGNFTRALSKISNIFNSQWEKEFNDSLYLKTLYHRPAYFYRELRRLEGALLLKSNKIDKHDSLRVVLYDFINDFSMDHLKAELFIKVGMNKRGENIYRKALEEHDLPILPSNTLNNIACLLIKNRNYDEACDLLQRCVEAEPDNPTYVINLAELYKQRGGSKTRFSFFYTPELPGSIQDWKCFEDINTPLMLTSKNDKVKELYKTIDKISDSDVNILLYGENGTGKEITARYIHSRSLRKEHPFVVIDCSSIPSSLIESELFGYEQGAFTGAETSKPGKIEKAANGSLFLDGIIHIPNEVQSKLLRFIQYHEFTPLGSEHTKKIDLRILASANTEIEKALKKGYLREDFFFRLNVLSLYIPALRERPEDIFPLFDLFKKYYSEQYDKSCPDLTPKQKSFFQNYNWPGNIRELQNLTERYILLEENEAIEMHTSIPFYGTSINNTLSIVNLQELEILAIKKALSTTQSKKEAAEKLGINPSTLWRKMNSYNIEADHAD